MTLRRTVQWVATVHSLCCCFCFKGSSVVIGFQVPSNYHPHHLRHLHLLRLRLPEVTILLRLLLVLLVRVVLFVWRGFCTI